MMNLSLLDTRFGYLQSEVGNEISQSYFAIQLATEKR